MISAVFSNRIFESLEITTLRIEKATG